MCACCTSVFLPYASSVPVVSLTHTDHQLHLSSDLEISRQHVRLHSRWSYVSCSTPISTTPPKDRTTSSLTQLPFVQPCVNSQALHSPVLMSYSLASPFLSSFPFTPPIKLFPPQTPPSFTLGSSTGSVLLYSPQPPLSSRLSSLSSPSSPGSVLVSISISFYPANSKVLPTSTAHMSIPG